jgi:hypothetical protein
LFPSAVLVNIRNFIIGPKGDTLDRVDLNGRNKVRGYIHVDDKHGERGYEEEGYFLNDKEMERGGPIFPGMVI